MFHKVVSIPTPHFLVLKGLVQKHCIQIPERLGVQITTFSSIEREWNNITRHVPPLNIRSYTVKHPGVLKPCFTLNIYQTGLCRLCCRRRTRRPPAPSWHLLEKSNNTSNGVVCKKWKPKMKEGLRKNKKYIYICIRVCVPQNAGFGVLMT